MHKTFPWMVAMHDKWRAQSGGVYVGRDVHFVNGSNIILSNGCEIKPYVDIFAGNEIVIGKDSYIGRMNRLCGDIVIEDAVLIGQNCYISTSTHCYENIEIPILFQGAYSPNKNGHNELQIGEGSWIGTHVAVIGDVHIGKHCIIGANSVVTRDIPDYCVAVGSPAKVIRQYDKETGEWINIDR